MCSVVEAHLWERGMETHRHMCKFLNGWNSRCLARITGRSEEEDARQPIDECNLVIFLRKQRFEWAGHILRRHESFPARKMLMKQQKPYEERS